MHTYSFDLSLSNTGLAIFDEKENVVFVGSVSTNSKEETKDRLVKIANYVLDLKSKYEPEIIIMENCFTRYNKATQMVYRVHGLIQYLFAEYNQIYITPASVKKSVTGGGKASKEDVQKYVLMKYPSLVFSNEDESDAVGIGLAYFRRKDRDV